MKKTFLTIVLSILAASSAYAMHTEVYFYHATDPELAKLYEKYNKAKLENLLYHAAANGNNTLVKWLVEQRKIKDTEGKALAEAKRMLASPYMPEYRHVFAETVRLLEEAQ